MRIMNVPCLSPPPLRPEYFATLRECMLEALAEHLGRDTFTEAVHAAWGSAFDAISSVIISNYPRSSDVEAGPAPSSTFGSQTFGI